MQEARQGRDTVEGVQGAWGLRARKSWLAELVHFAREYPLGAAGGGVLLFLVFVAAFAPFIAPHEPLAQNLPNRLTGPSPQFYFGTDGFGRDMFSRIVFGARTSLYVGFFSVVLGTGVGVILGVASGYIGGKFDLLIQRLVDTLMGFPSIVLAMVMVVAPGASLNNVVIAIGITMTPRMIRLSRSTALTIKEEVYVLSAKAIGGSTMRIILHHVLPNGMAPVFVVATAALGSAIVAEAGLSFLGLGVPPPSASWGGLLRQGAVERMESAPWLAIFPGLALSSVVFSFALLGDALRDRFDPRLRGTR